MACASKDETRIRLRAASCPSFVLPDAAYSHQFTGAKDDGECPRAGLAMDAAGVFYETTEMGGESGFGTVYRFVPSSTAMRPALTLVRHARRRVGPCCASGRC
jgi:uncharacterized repeat protein (TIGR03803 family)